MNEPSGERCDICALPHSTETCPRYRTMPNGRPATPEPVLAKVQGAGKRGHVHGYGCNRVVRIFYISPVGTRRAWNVSASCIDDEVTMRAHFARWRPGFEWVGCRVARAGEGE